MSALIAGVVLMIGALTLVASRGSASPPPSPTPNQIVQWIQESQEREQRQVVLESLEHKVMGRWIQESLENHKRLLAIALPSLLTPSKSIVSEYSDLLSRKDLEPAGINRILERGKFDQLDGVEGYRGGGAYFSFTTRTNDYNQRPDLEFQHGAFSSGFYGGQLGHRPQARRRLAPNGRPR